MIFNIGVMNFGKEFSRLGAVRSLIPEELNIMALTATATKSLQRTVIRILGMYNPLIVAVSLDKTNINFSVSPFESMQTAFQPIMAKIKKCCLNMERTLIFLRNKKLMRGSIYFSRCFWVSNLLYLLDTQICHSIACLTCSRVELIPL